MKLIVAHTADLPPDTLADAEALLYEVFDDMTPEDWEHCLGGMHVVAFEGDEPIGHAAVVQRRLIHDGRPLRAGYVEGVAVRRSQRRKGVGAAVMTEAERLITGAYHLGALGTTDEARVFYEGRGWLPWRGQTWALTPDGVVRTADEDGGIYVFEASATLDPSGSLTCDWREGELW